MPCDESDPLAKRYLSALTQALAGMGWTDGRNVRMDLRGVGGDTNRMRALAQQLVGLQPDVILASGAGATVALQRETQTIPIVFAGVGDPVASGLVAKLNQPAGISPASPTSNPRWEASGLSGPRSSRPRSGGAQTSSH